MLGWYFVLCCGQLDICNYKMSIKMDRLVFVSVIEGCIMIQWILKWILQPKPRHDCKTFLSLSIHRKASTISMYCSLIVYKSRFNDIIWHCQIYISGKIPYEHLSARYRKKILHPYSFIFIFVKAHDIHDVAHTTHMIQYQTTLRAQNCIFGCFWIFCINLLNWFFKCLVHTFREKMELKSVIHAWGLEFLCSQSLTQWSTEVVTLDV